NGLGFALAGALRNAGGSNLWAGNITLGSTAAVGADAFSQLTIGDTSPGGKGVIDDAGKNAALYKEGKGLVILTLANTYGGDTVVDAGELNIQNVRALGKG